MNAKRELAELAVAVEIESFLSGNSDGAALFQALYGAAADEPVPERLLALVREQCEPMVDAAAVPAADAAPSLDAAAS